VNATSNRCSPEGLGSGIYVTAMSQHIRVFHCDDSPAFTRLVRHWLQDHEGLTHVGAANTGEAVLAALAEARPDVILLDTMGAPHDGSLLASIREAAPQARVIVYSGYLSILDADDLGGHADAYLAKGDDEEALVAAIRAAAAHA
jgi:DNA-binding NarL/FixJ family response regulator